MNINIGIIIALTCLTIALVKRRVALAKERLRLSEANGYMLRDGARHFILTSKTSIEQERRLIKEIKLANVRTKQVYITRHPDL